MQHSLSEKSAKQYTDINICTSFFFPIEFKIYLLSLLKD
jgi:hypothetical protein